MTEEGCLEAYRDAALWREMLIAKGTINAALDDKKHAAFVKSSAASKIGRKALFKDKPVPKSNVDYVTWNAYKCWWEVNKSFDNKRTFLGAFIPINATAAEIRKEYLKAVATSQ